VPVIYTQVTMTMAQLRCKNSNACGLSSLLLSDGNDGYTVEACLTNRYVRSNLLTQTISLLHVFFQNKLLILMARDSQLMFTITTVCCNTCIPSTELRTHPFTLLLLFCLSENEVCCLTSPEFLSLTACNHCGP